MTIKRRLEKLERLDTTRDGVVFISTGVPGHDKVGQIDVAITPQGWLTKRPYETDAKFESRVRYQ